MRIGMVTHDMSKCNRHLMPWRTLDEVCGHLAAAGHHTTLISMDHQGPKVPHQDSDEIVHLSKKPGGLAKRLSLALDQVTPEVLFWPLTWRDSISRVPGATRFNLPLVGYFPGGVYRPRSSLYAAWQLGIGVARPYLLEAFWPRSRRVRQWQGAGFKTMLALTDYTARQLQRAGWPRDRIRVTPPGREPLQKPNKHPGLPDILSRRKQERPYYLFTGPPSRIRGIGMLLAAFDRLAPQIGELDLVCLFRADAALDRKRIQRRINRSPHTDRIYCHWDSVGPDALQTIIRNCHAVVLPFVLVPSEIPLTILEVMAQGRPVITTNQGGTGEFTARFGMVVESHAPKQLARAMQRLIVDDDYYQGRCRAALAAWKTHPTWPEVARDWLHSAGMALGRTKN